MIIGIQFLAWTVGGLYFSWTDLDKVHGSDLIAPAPELDGDVELVPVELALKNLSGFDHSQIRRLELLPISNTAAVFKLNYTSASGEPESQLFDALTGLPRSGLNEEESRDLAIARYSGVGELIETDLIEATGSHDEYRELPLPAYAFTFNDNRGTRIYVAPEHARVTSVRNSNWRVFDFLWMMHTMDYEGRDNFNNLLLRAFAMFGLLTLLSGFALFLVSSKVVRHATR